MNRRRGKWDWKVGVDNEWASVEAVRSVKWWKPESIINDTSYVDLRLTSESHRMDGLY